MPSPFSIASPPANGTLSGTPPTVKYKAAAGFVGTDSFTFTAADGYGTSAPATVSITVTDVPSHRRWARLGDRPPGKAAVIAVLANDAAGSGTIDTATMRVTAPPATGSSSRARDGRRPLHGASRRHRHRLVLVHGVRHGGGCATATVACDHRRTMRRSPPTTASTWRRRHVCARPCRACSPTTPTGHRRPPAGAAGARGDRTASCCSTAAARSRTCRTRPASTRSCTTSSTRRARCRTRPPSRSSSPARRGRRSSATTCSRSSRVAS